MAVGVMPGGFARLAFSGALRNSLIGEAICRRTSASSMTALLRRRPIDRRNSASCPQRRRHIIEPGGGQFFWFSRHSERAEMTVRVRSLLGGSIDADGGSSHDSGVTEKLVGLLVQWALLLRQIKISPSPRSVASFYRAREGGRRWRR